MADYAATSIEIGGRIETVEAFERLRDAVVDDGGPIDWQSGATLTDIERHLLDAHGTDGVIFCDNEVAWGKFDEIEAACKEIGLHYCRADDGCVGCWGPNRIYFHPESGETEMDGGDETGPTVLLGDVAKWLADGSLAERIDKALGVMRLPKFEIADNVRAQVQKNARAEMEGCP